MNGFLDRVKLGVKQAASATAQAATQVSQAAQQLREVIASPGSVNGPVISRGQQQQHYNSDSPRDVLISLVHSVCGVIDQHAISDGADSLEGDRVLYESNAREYLRHIIDMLIADGARWVDSMAGAAGSSDVELECVDAFLQTNAMHELCRRAGRDLPRGCLPMVLAFVSTLLKQVRYPLLPHQTVYRPLARLLSITCRLDAVLGRGHTAAQGTSPERSLEMANYTRRVDTALCGLLGTLWKKAGENPAVLDFFTQEDTRGLGRARLAPQMDMLSALLPLVHLPRVGQLARDALLVALSLHDRRVDAFLVHHTALLRDVANSLGQHFTAATVPVVTSALPTKALMPLPLPEGLFVPGGISQALATPPPPGAGRAGDLRSGPAGPVDAYLRTLRFACLVLVAASPEPNLSLEPPLALEQRAAAYSVRAAACENYVQGFLAGCLRGLLGGLGDELASVAATSLLRFTLRELELFSQDCALLPLTIRFLLDLPGGAGTNDFAAGRGKNGGGKKPKGCGRGGRGDFVFGLVQRCSSMFPQVSLSSTQLVSALLQLASLEEAFVLLAKGQDGAEDGRNEAGDDPASSTLPPATPATPPMRELLDARLGSACKAFADRSSPVAGASPAAAWLAPSFLSATYTDAAAKEVLARLASRSALPLKGPPGASPGRASPGADGLSEYLPGSFSLCDVSEFLQRDWAAAHDRSAVLGLVRRRLGSFLGLKLDEQVAIAGLVAQVLALFCAAVVSATEVDNEQGGRCLDFMLEVLRLLEGLWAEAAKHLQDLPGLAAKAAAIAHLLLAGAQGGPVDASSVKLFEKEPPRVARVLEAATMLREMVAQAAGYLHAAERLRMELADPAGPFAQTGPRQQPGGQAVYLGDAEEDAWERDHPSEAALSSEGDEAAPSFTTAAELEEAFAREFALCEAQIEGALAH